MAENQGLPVVAGINGLPKVVLAAADGARAEVYLHGAHVTSWVTPDGREQLFLSRTSDFRPGAAIRGGVPVIFPQFSNRGPLPKHGFARAETWTLAGVERRAGSTTATFTLTDNAGTRAVWPYAFNVELAVTAGGFQLALDLTVHNTGDRELSFTAALHTYLRVAEVDAAAVGGLQGAPYLDTTPGGCEEVQTDPELRFVGEVDRIYFAAPAHLRLQEPGRNLAIQAAGFLDAVTWNPGRAKGQALPDLEPEGYRRFVCVEAAVIGQPISLLPGASWHGSQTLLAEA